MLPIAAFCIDGCINAPNYRCDSSIQVIIKNSDLLRPRRYVPTGRSQALQQGVVIQGMSTTLGEGEDGRSSLSILHRQVLDMVRSGKVRQRPFRNIEPLPKRPLVLLAELPNLAMKYVLHLFHLQRHKGGDGIDCIAKTGGRTKVIIDIVACGGGKVLIRNIFDTFVGMDQLEHFVRTEIRGENKQNIVPTHSIFLAYCRPPDGTVAVDFCGR
mmetsp:Transcript_25925/g.74959  ORF Transcript_25925/g.74959 Transcript_25925/m.74959 type:complete len:213 (-) Transcript_25925:1947-2585(-)